jgi:hypothetical protein
MLFNIVRLFKSVILVNMLYNMVNHMLASEKTEEADP